MAGSKAGGATLRNTMIERFGSEEAWREHMRGIASKGGKSGFTGGYWHAKYVQGDVNFIRECGMRGGRKSKRRPRVS